MKLHEKLGITPKELVSSFDYLFRFIDNKTFKAQVNDGFNVKKRIDACGYMLKNCKLYAYAWHCHKQGLITRPKAAEFEIEECDVAMLRKLDLSRIPAHFQPFALREFDAYLAEFLTSSDLSSVLGKFITKKMTFLIKSYGQTREALKSAMVEAAIYNIYRCFPYYDSYLHFCNIGKGASEKYGHSLIKHFTAKKNQVLQKNADGTHESRMVPIAAVEHMLESPNETKQTIKDVLEGIKLKPRVRLFFQLMAGEHDQGFSEYLGVNNSDAADTMKYSHYRARVQKYLGVTHTQVNNLLERLRNKVNGNA
ncbi:hypothetical protein [Achromobacter phage Motura]|uniref:Uncharacterized protein n=1 Tax=Achromobacter phage Motura TaxID=2591403 RepID=A0A514CSN3_9CAUD|nr:hypothetical protein H1O15_gp323 [Achromobacter phage Motura]QDH83483.1 hypothetical protein [Achromobacter phage Motura]